MENNKVFYSKVFNTDELSEQEKIALDTLGKALNEVCEILGVDEDTVHSFNPEQTRENLSNLHKFLHIINRSLSLHVETSALMTMHFLSDLALHKDREAIIETLSQFANIINTCILLGIDFSVQGGDMDEFSTMAKLKNAIDNLLDPDTYHEHIKRIVIDKKKERMELLEKMNEKHRSECDSCANEVH